jgi:hypothetical protein
MNCISRLSVTIALLVLCAPQATSRQNNAAFFDGLSTGFPPNGGLGVITSAPLNANAKPAAYTVGGTTISVEAWVYPIAFPSPQYTEPIVTGRLLNPSASDPVTAYHFAVAHVDGVPHAYFSVGDNQSLNSIAAVSPEEIQAYRWTHVAGTYDGNYIKIYVNGVLKSQAAANFPVSTRMDAFCIGGWGASLFQGLIDEVRLWKVARTQSEIQSSMNMELAGTESGLVGYWKMNGTSVINQKTIVPDETGNHNDLQVLSHAKMVGMNPWIPAGTPSISISPSLVDLGTLEQGAAPTKTVSITNPSATPLIGRILTSSSGIVQYASTHKQLTYGLSFFVGPGAAVSTTIYLYPTCSGVVNGGLSFESNAGTSSSVPVVVRSIAMRRFDANAMGLWMQRKGGFVDLLSSPMDYSPVLEWPRGSGKTAVFCNGVWIGAKVDGVPRTATAFYNTEFGPGPIINGAAANTNDSTYRIYKIRRGDNASTNPDYATWPKDLGAPVSADGTPAIIGDQTLFGVYNDADPANHALGSAPLMAEVQQTVFGFNQSAPLANTVFFRFKIINKGTKPWNDTYISFWSDPDLGYYGDDFVGSDSARQLAYAFNSSNSDSVYGVAPPAVGYRLLKGVLNAKAAQSFAYFTIAQDYAHTDPSTAAGAYNFMSGHWADGTSYINPLTSQATLWGLNGDPVTGSGWIDSSPWDRRMLLSTGPFTLEPGQTKEIIAALIISRGSNNLNSIAALRADADAIKTMFDAGAIFGGVQEHVSDGTAAPGQPVTLSDIAASGSQCTVTGGASGATVELASYVGPPPGAQAISSPSLSGVGKYLDVQVQGSLAWPADLRIYYTQNDLQQAGIAESDLQGLYYWSGLTNQWVLYSNSGSDDQGRGTSTTSVDTANVTIGGVHYEGCVHATAYHLTPMVIGTKGKATYLEENAGVPAHSWLSQNYPNPFNPRTTIRFELPKEEHVCLRIYNTLGQPVATLLDESRRAGVYQVEWNALSVPSGVYFYRLQATGFEQNLKMIVLK